MDSYGTGLRHREKFSPGFEFRHADLSVIMGPCAIGKFNISQQSVPNDQCSLIIWERELRKLGEGGPWL